MTTQNQEHIDLNQVLLNAQQLPIRTESVINVAEVPSNAKEQIESRTKMWAVQNGGHFTNEYVAFAAYNALQCAQQLLHEEIELSLNDIWRSKHILLWEGIKQGLQSSEKNHPMTELKKNYKKIQQRANAYHFDPLEDKLTLEIDPENAVASLSIDRCHKLHKSIEQAMIWLTHRIMLASSIAQANEVLKFFHAEFSDSLVSRIPDVTPQSLQTLKQLGLNKLYEQIKGFEKPNMDKPRDLRISKMPDELYDTLDAGGAFDVKPATLSDSSVSSPMELVHAIALKHKVDVISMSEWKANPIRDKCVFVRHFDFQSIKKSSLGRAQYLLLGPTSDFDIRVELKNQTQSGSASDKLPMNIYRLQKMQRSNAYNKTLIGVIDSTYFADDTMELAKTIADLDQKMEFKTDEELSQTLHNMVEHITTLFEQIKKGLACPQKEVIDILGLAEPIVKIHKKNELDLTDQLKSIVNDDDFGIDSIA